MGTYRFDAKKIIFGLMFSMLFLGVSPHFTAEGAGNDGAKLLKLEAEILEVEELKEPPGSVIYTVKDLSSGSTVRLYADRHRTLVQMGGAPMAAADMLWGGRATIIYREAGEGKLPEIVFAKVSNAYYSSV